MEISREVPKGKPSLLISSSMIEDNRARLSGPMMPITALPEVTSAKVTLAPSGMLRISQW